MNSAGFLPNTMRNKYKTFIPTRRNDDHFTYRSIYLFLPTLRTASAPWRSRRGMWDFGTGDKETFKLLSRFCYWCSGIILMTAKGLYHIIIRNYWSNNSYYQSDQHFYHHQHNGLYSHIHSSDSDYDNIQQQRRSCEKKRSVKKDQRKLKPKHANLKKFLEYIPYHWTDPLTYIDNTAVIYPIKYNFSKIQELFITTSQYQLKIEYVQRVENPFLFLMYQIKKEELCAIYGKDNVIEQHLFHGTKMENIGSICTNNFDWRRYGYNKGHLFGKGVSFSPFASYASHYTDENAVGRNQMILALVLIVKTCEGKKNYKLPPLPWCDTTMKRDGTVYVKYHDSTFYPQYLITYTGVIVNRNN